MSLEILTANNLHSGGVVFLTPQGDWSPFVILAEIFANAETTEKLETSGRQAVDAQIIVGPYPVAVTIEDGVPRPVRFREQLRVGGPSVRSDFSKPLFKEAA